MNRLSFSLLILIGLTSCKKPEDSINKFSDPVLVKIADLKDRRASDSLYAFFSHKNPVYRKEAALAFGSIQDSSAVDNIGQLLTDPDTSVRKFAAFALGQTLCKKTSMMLKDAILKEQDGDVLNEIIEAYGKVTKKWSATISENASNGEGIAWSLYRAGLNNAVDPSLNKKAAVLLTGEHNDFTRMGAAHFFARGSKNPEGFLPVLSNASKNDKNDNVRMAAAAALRKIKNDSTLITLERILESEPDYRVKVNAVTALNVFPFEKVKDHLLRALNDKNVNVRIAASEVIKANLTEEFWIEIANRVTDIKNWRIQANLYQAIVMAKENQSIIDEIKTTYQRSVNPYQKAALLAALQESVKSYDFIQGELFKADTPVVRSSAAAALVAINKNKKFQAPLKKTFADIYIRAMQTGDAAVIGTLANALADSTLDYRTTVKDYTFLYNARKKLSLPGDSEVLQPLEAAIAYFEKRRAPEVRNDFNHPINWPLVKGIPKDQLAVIKTSRGNITIRLLVEEAPGSVANFVNLAEKNYFDHKFFHRVVPNFVIQAGCNRGDGWGSEDYSIRSEFSPRRYTTGSVGMASAGKDTEGTQWFITHSPTPHLDGRYTIFAEVVSGMEVVHLIEAGDQIIDVNIESKDPDKK